MHLTRTKPQPKLPDDEDPRAWQGGNGYHPDYRDPGYIDGYADKGAGPRAGDARSGGYEDDGAPVTTVHKRRWPIVGAVLVLLVLVVGGGLFGGLQYLRGQYYIGAQAGHVAVFRGVDQDVAGISLSSLVQQYPGLPVAHLDAGSQAQVKQTISYSSLQQARSVVQRLQGQVTQCQHGYQALAQWQTANVQYQKSLNTWNHLSAAKKKKGHKPTAPPAEPTAPPQAECAPSTAFGIPASALPGKSS